MAITSPRADLGSKAAPFPDVEERRALYRDLVRAVRRYHLFSDATASNLGIDWDDSLSGYESVFVEAADEAALREALDRFANSLHDPHLGYEPETPGEELSLGLTLEGIWHGPGASGAGFAVRSVDSAALRGRVEPGDRLLSAGGVPAERLTQTCFDRTKANNLPAAVSGVASFLAHRNTHTSNVRIGDKVRWRLQRPDTKVSYEIELTWSQEKSNPQTVQALRTDPDYSLTRCHPYDSNDAYSLPDRHYSPSADGASGYKITGVGNRFCLYTAEKPPYRYYPIVRHYSFFYYAGYPNSHEEDAQLNNAATYAVLADYYALSRLLRARPETRGLIVDLRDNGGGNDPEWFLDWYAPAPYEDHYIVARVAPEWQDPAFTSRVVNIDEDWLKWYRRAAIGRANGTWLRRPFKCLRPDCSGGNRFSPGRALVTAPVALLVGRGCNSSCAHVAQIFDENDFGPLIGEPAQATQTSQHHPYPVRTSAGLKLGQLKLALSTDESGKTGKRLEGALPHVDYPISRTFDNRDTIDAAHVTAALRAFGEYPFPKRVTPLGP